jgi:hypothetical protein
MKFKTAWIHGIFKLLFGDFNGVQVFMFPMTIFWWMESNSFLKSITLLISYQKHYFPLCIFLLAFLYTLFLVLKNYSSVFSSVNPATQAEKRAMGKIVIKLHKTLLITLVCIGLVYVLSEFLRYYYGIRIPLKEINPYVFRAFSTFLILDYTMSNSWIKSFRSQGFSWEYSVKLVSVDFRKRTLPYVNHAFVYLLMMIVSSFVYYLIIIYILFPLLSLLGIAPKLVLLSPVNFAALIYDVLIFGVAFMLSNLLYSPFVILVSHYAEYFHPRWKLMNKEESREEETEENEKTQESPE